MKGEVEAATRATDGFGVGVELRSIALSLSIEKSLDVAACVFAQLVVGNPLRPLHVFDVAIDAEAALAVA